jgi:hypothetical protein
VSNSSRSTFTLFIKLRFVNVEQDELPTDPLLLFPCTQRLLLYSRLGVLLLVLVFGVVGLWSSVLVFGLSVSWTRTHTIGYGVIRTRKDTHTNGSGVSRTRKDTHTNGSGVIRTCNKRRHFMLGLLWGVRVPCELFHLKLFYVKQPSRVCANVVLPKYERKANVLLL